MTECQSQNDADQPATKWPYRLKAKLGGRETIASETTLPVLVAAEVVRDSPVSSMSLSANGQAGIVGVVGVLVPSLRA